MVSNYFVDESGDPEIFGSRGKILLGTPGCSQFFFLGFLEVKDPGSLSKDLGDLRSQLLANPYYQGVPSLQPAARKTFEKFHAKDDLPEIRKEVFDLLRGKDDLRFFAVVKSKQKVLEYALRRRAADSAYRYSPNELYDFLARRLFKQKLHVSNQYKVHYGIRGTKPRTAAMQSALLTAQKRYMKERGITDTATLEVVPSNPVNTVCLQATDYFLWALNRMYTKRESRYLEYLWNSFRLVIDIDDTRRYPYGEYFTQQNRLTVDSIDHPIK